MRQCDEERVTSVVTFAPGQGMSRFDGVSVVDYELRVDPICSSPHTGVYKEWPSTMWSGRVL